ncbi:MAG: hypothetical protein Q7R77_02595 [Candidatus Daviesbacteria bacterium]|nr:hypothetical protein [Candidatus Daviesbacteria bacterium]
MTEAFKKIQPVDTVDRINAAKRSLRILGEIGGKPWTALPLFSPGRIIGRRLADEVVELTIALRDREGKISG